MKRIPGLTISQTLDDEPRQRPLELRLFKRILRYALPYRRTLGWLLFCVVMRSMQLPLLAWTLSSVIKGPITHGTVRDLVLGVTAYAALGLFTNFILLYRMRMGLLLGECAVHDIRGDIFEHLQQMTMHFFHTTRLGRLISRITSDAESVRAGLQNAVFVSMVCSGQLLIALAVMIYTDRNLFVVVLLTTPLYYLTYQYFRRRMSTAWREVQESFSRITANLAESVSGIHVTQSFSREELNARQFRTLVEDHAEYNMGVVRASGTFSPVVELMGQMLIGLLFMAGGYLTLSSGGGGTQVEDLIVFYFLLHEVLTPVAALGNQYNTAVTAMAGAERVFTLLDREPEYCDPPDAIELPRLDGRVEFQDLDFAYEGDRLVLEHISFVAAPGQTIALVGHTGSGKTSIINLIAKFYLPTRGQLLLDGVDVRRIRAESLHHQMGIVLQQNFLFTGTVLDNIRVGRPAATEEEVRAAAERLGVLGMIEALPQGFQAPVGEGGAGLSLGQRQVICFARAMLADPRILVLDEATSNVDSITETRIQNALALLLSGRTSFVVAHRLSTVRHADLVLVLDRGHIVERGTHIDLLAADGVYTKLYCQFVREVEAE